MKNILPVAASLSFVTGIVFLVRTFVMFPVIMIKTDTPGIYLLMYIACLFLFYITFSFLFENITNKRNEALTNKALTNIESIALIVQFTSVILLLLCTIESFYGLYPVSYYPGYILLLLGGAAYYKFRHSISISFISWGIFILLWNSGFYYGVYTTSSM